MKDNTILPSYEETAYQGKQETDNLNLIIYTKNHCPQCMMTKKLLDRDEVPYQEINIEDHPEMVDYLRAKGYQAVPVVELEYQEAFVGFQPEKLREVISVLRDNDLEKGNTKEGVGRER